MTNDASKDGATSSQENKEALTGSGAFEKRADVFPVAPAEIFPLDQIMSGPGPMMMAPASPGDSPSTGAAGAPGDGDSSGE